MANELIDMYNQVPGEVISQSAQTTVEGGPGELTPPPGYEPLTNKQRGDWNDFIRYLNRDLKIGGSPQLDERSRAVGLDHLKKYAADHKGFSITPEMVPYVQYEFQVLRDTGTLPNVADEGYAKQFLNWQGAELAKRNISDVDGWIGSLTSRQAYQEIQPIEQDPDKRYWGTDYEGASKFFTELQNKRRSATGAR